MGPGRGRDSRRDEGVTGMNDDGEDGRNVGRDGSRDEGGTVLPLTRHKCPMCGKAAAGAYKPFCSKRCADLDLARWLGEGYRIPTSERPGEGDFGDDDEA